MGANRELAVFAHVGSFAMIIGHTDNLRKNWRELGFVGVCLILGRGERQVPYGRYFALSRRVALLYLV